MTLFVTRLCAAQLHAWCLIPPDQSLCDCPCHDRIGPTCARCGDLLDRNRGARGDRCGTCDTYRRRHGTDRPDNLIIKQTEKDIERALTRRANYC